RGDKAAAARKPDETAELNWLGSSMQRNLWLSLMLILILGSACGLRGQPGTLDPGFNAGFGVDLSVYSMAIQTNGQILIAGNFTSVDSVERINLARLNAGGSRDDGFNPGSAFGDYLNAVALQSDGKILVGGSFTNSAAMHFGRMQTNGTLDTSFT